MLEVIPQKFIDFIIGISILAVLGLLFLGIQAAIENRQYRTVSKSENKIVEVGIIGLALLYVVVFIILPAYVVIHFIVK